jgi:multidrug efflux pump subunit AcrA (membrane-fusion protein)
MIMKKIITSLIGLALVVGAIIVFKSLINSKPERRQRPDKVIKTVYVDKVINREIPITINAKGNLVAKNRIDLFSEVQGVLLTTDKEFKPGTFYQKGEAIVKMNSDEFYANLQANKSIFFNSLTAIMPDIQLDYPDAYDKWKRYLDQFDMDGPLKALPDFNSDKEKFFVSGRGILSNYYSVNNMEVKLSKYVLKAPYNGVLTEASVNPGTLIRPGQKLGEFINTNTYEMAVSIKSAYRDMLAVGKPVQLFNLENTQSWTGKVVRINGKVDTQTQTIKVFIEVKGKALKEGQYLEINLQAKTEQNAFEIPRNLLVDETKMYVVKDSILELIDIHPLFENKNSIVIRGLDDNTFYLSKPVPGAYSGMRVKIFNNNNKAE